MSKLIPIMYKTLKYPRGITPTIQEIPANFKKDKISPIMDYSLHTEFSHRINNKFNNPLLNDLTTIRSSQMNNVPQLWYSEVWVDEFIVFIKRIIGENTPPKIIEIHPPYNDYCRSLDRFMGLYETFERQILSNYPNAQIVIENRFGKVYPKANSKFLISNSEDLFNLSKEIKDRDLNLRIVLDIPQLFSSYGLNPGKFTEEKITEIINSVYEYRDYIYGIHIWGKNEMGRSHYGDLNTYFVNKELKKLFLEKLYELLDDGKKRYFVPECNGSYNDLISIVNDFIDKGFKFV